MEQRTPWKAAFDVYFDWWHRQAKTRAWQDPTWAAIEERRHDSDTRSTLFLSEEHDLGWPEWETQGAIFDRLNPTPWIFKARWWLQKNGYAAHRAYLVRGWQRARNGWAVSDTWNLDHYLAEVIAGSVQHIRSHAHGHPGDITFDEWLDILDRIVAGFQPLADSDGSDHEDASKPQRDEAFQLLAHWFRGLWD